jgi:hypothetical protein
VQDVVKDSVAVGDQPEHHGHHEPEDAHHQVYDPQGQHHAAGRGEVHPAEAHVGKEAARGQVDYVLDYVDVEDAQPHLVAEHQPNQADQDEHHPKICANRLILQRHFALSGSAAPVSETLQHSLIAFATH